jgi:hypothetical protein
MTKVETEIVKKRVNLDWFDTLPDSRVSAFVAQQNTSIKRGRFIISAGCKISKFCAKINDYTQCVTRGYKK